MAGAASPRDQGFELSYQDYIEEAVVVNDEDVNVDHEEEEPLTTSSAPQRRGSPIMSEASSQHTVDIFPDITRMASVEAVISGSSAHGVDHDDDLDDEDDYSDETDASFVVEKQQEHLVEENENEAQDDDDVSSSSSSSSDSEESEFDDELLVSETGMMIPPSFSELIPKHEVLRPILSACSSGDGSGTGDDRYAPTPSVDVESSSPPPQQPQEQPDEVVHQEDVNNEDDDEDDEEELELAQKEDLEHDQEEDPALDQELEQNHMVETTVMEQIDNVPNHLAEALGSSNDSSKDWVEDLPLEEEDDPYLQDDDDEEEEEDLLNDDDTYTTTYTDGDSSRCTTNFIGDVLMGQEDDDDDDSVFTTNTTTTTNTTNTNLAPPLVHETTMSLVTPQKKVNWRNGTTPGSASHKKKGPMSPFSPHARVPRGSPSQLHQGGMSQVFQLEDIPDAPDEEEENVDPYTLSLSQCRKVSVVVRVKPPPISTTTTTTITTTPTRSKQRNNKSKSSTKRGTTNHDTTTPSALCLFPLLSEREQQQVAATTAAAAAASNNDEETTLSPVAAAMTAASMSNTKDLVVVNPKVFGKYVPGEVTMETARLVAQVAHISSEDWARRYRFDQVLWPDSVDMNTTTTDNNNNNTPNQNMNHHANNTQSTTAALAYAVVDDAVTRKQNSALFGMGGMSSGKTHTMFGTVAACFQDVDPLDDDVPLSSKGLTDRMGLLGLMVRELLPHEDAGTISMSLSMVEVLSDDTQLRDLLSPHTATNANGQVKPLKIRHPDHRGAVVQNLSEVRLESLEQLQELLWQAYDLLSIPQTFHGHVLATIKVFHENTNRNVAFGVQTDCTLIQLVDLVAADMDGKDVKRILADSAATPGKSSKYNPASSLVTRQVASVRKSLSGLRGVLRGLVIKDCQDNSSKVASTFSYRECSLTKLLQRTLDNKDSKAVMIATVDPSYEAYTKTLHTLNYLHHLFLRAGTTAKSPFDAKMMNGQVLGDSTSGKERLMESSSPHTSLLLSQAHDTPAKLLKSMVTDPRQRLAKLLETKSPAVPSRQRPDPLAYAPDLIDDKSYDLEEGESVVYDSPGFVFDSPYVKRQESKNLNVDESIETKVRLDTPKDEPSVTSTGQDDDAASSSDELRLELEEARASEHALRQELDNVRAFANDSLNLMLQRLAKNKREKDKDAEKLRKAREEALAAHREKESALGELRAIKSSVTDWVSPENVALLKQELEETRAAKHAAAERAALLLEQLNAEKAAMQEVEGQSKARDEFFLARDSADDVENELVFQYQEDIARLENQIRDATSDRVAAEEIAEEAILGREGVEQELSYLKGKLYGSQEEARDLLSKYGDAIEAKLEVEVELQKAKEIGAILHEQEQDMVAEVSALREELENEKRRSLENERDAEDAQNKALNAEETISQMTSANRDLNGVLSQYKADAQSQEEAFEYEAERIRSEKSHIEAELSEVKRKHDDEVNLLKQALQTMSNNVIASQEGVPGLEQRLNSLTHELAESEEMVKDAVRAREDASSRLADIEASSREREDELSRLRTELETQNTIIEENELLLAQLKQTSHESRSMAREDQASQSMPSVQLAHLQVENQHLEKNMKKRLDEIEGERAKAQQMKEENYMLKRSTRKSEKIVAELKKEIDTMKSNSSNETFQREEAQRIAHEKELLDERNQADEELKDVLTQLNIAKVENENLMMEMNEVRGSNQDLRMRRSSSSSPTSWHTTETTEGKNMIDAYHMEREHRMKSDEMAATLAKRAKAGFEQRNAEIIDLKMRLSSMRDEKEAEVSKLKADLLNAKRMIATSAGVVPRDVSQYLNTYSSPAPYVRPSLDVEYLNHAEHERGDNYRSHAGKLQSDLSQVNHQYQSRAQPDNLYDRYTSPTDQNQGSSSNHASYARRDSREIL